MTPSITSCLHSLCIMHDVGQSLSGENRLNHVMKGSVFLPDHTAWMLLIRAFPRIPAAASRAICP